jgi:hypothetical protein
MIKVLIARIEKWGKGDSIIYYLVYLGLNIELTAIGIYVLKLFQTSQFVGSFADPWTIYIMPLLILCSLSGCCWAKFDQNQKGGLVLLKPAAGPS